MYKSLIIRENAIHQLDTNDSVQFPVYLDAQCEMAKRIKVKYLVNSIEKGLLQKLRYAASRDKISHFSGSSAKIQEMLHFRKSEQSLCISYIDQ